MEDGRERPIAYTSRTLTSAEKKYSQLKKEGLAIVFGTKKFHNYFYGRSFYIEFDHQPISYLFIEAREIPRLASSRIQRWALTLSAYQYSIRYKQGKQLSNADAISRLPRAITTSSDFVPGDLSILCTIYLSQPLAQDTSKSGLGKVWYSRENIVIFLLDAEVDEALRPYKFRRNELTKNIR